MKGRKMNRVGLFLTVLVLLAACGSEYTPKPRGYFRIDLPEKKYCRYDSICPFSFDYPVYAVIEHSDDMIKDPCSFNLVFPAFRARFYLTYKAGGENINGYIEESHKFVYKHTIKADAINERLYLDTIRNVYGVLYQIKGNAASSLQFYLTDSAEHFLRGSLYFNSVPNKDSLLPVIEFLQEDMMYLMESLQWKKK